MNSPRVRPERRSGAGAVRGAAVSAALAIGLGAGLLAHAPVSAAGVGAQTDGGAGPAVATRILSLRADRADGLAPYPVPGAGSPWQDLAGDHDATLWNFLGNPSSGWKGDGSVASPRRLEFGGEDPLVLDRCVIPANSVPELQTLDPVTVALWFRAGFDAPWAHYDYLLEWVEPPLWPDDPEVEGRGMSIALEGGQVVVYQNAWVSGGPVSPGSWHHVVVVKAPGELRIYLDGQRTYTGTHPHMGTQESEIVLGCSTFRVFEGQTGEAAYGDHFSGSIAQVDVWSGALDDAEVTAAYDADRALYPSGPTPPAPTRLVTLRADQADGVAPHPIPGAASPWKDLSGAPHDAALLAFAGDTASGWQGSGTVLSPYRLQFDGSDDAVTIPAGSVAELQNTEAVSAELWFRTGPDVAAGDYRYLIEWLQGFGATPGLSIAVANGGLQVFFGTPYWTDVAPLASNTWYHVIVAKEPGEARVYLNGARVHSSGFTRIGDQTTEIVIGASTWRGAGQYGDFWNGAIALAAIWHGALDDAGALAAYLADEDVFPYALRVAIAGQGTVARDPDLPGYEHGALVELTAIPDPGYGFSGWSGDASGNDNPLLLPMNDHRSVTATFTSLAAAGAAAAGALAITSVTPNPAHGALGVGYRLPAPAPVRLEVVDLQGRTVARLVDAPHPAGRFEARWDGRSGGREVAGGIYFVRLRAGARDLSRRFVLVR